MKLATSNQHVSSIDQRSEVNVIARSRKCFHVTRYLYMKLGTNIHQMTGMDEQVFKVRSGSKFKVIGRLIKFCGDAISLCWREGSQ